MLLHHTTVLWLEVLQFSFSRRSTKLYLASEGVKKLLTKRCGSWSFPKVKERRENAKHLQSSGKTSSKNIDRTCKWSRCGSFSKYNPSKKFGPWKSRNNIPLCSSTFWSRATKSISKCPNRHPDALGEHCLSMLDVLWFITGLIDSLMQWYDSMLPNFSTSIYCKRGEKELCTSFPQHITHSSKLGTWDSGNLAWSPDPCRAVPLVLPNLVRAHRSQMTCIFRHLDFGRQRRHLHKWPEKRESLRFPKTSLFGWLMPKGLVERIVLWYAALLPNPNANCYTMIMIMKYLTYSNDSKVCSIPLKWCVIFCLKKTANHRIPLHRLLSLLRCVGSRHDPFPYLA